MLSKLSQSIAACHRYAEQSAQAAKIEADPRLQECWLNLEMRWLLLARSYELTEQLKRLSPKETPQLK
jgi:hypothetical protein